MCFLPQYRSQFTGDNESKGGKKKDSSKQGCEHELNTS